MNLQHGLFAKISTKNLIGGVGRSKEKNCHEFFCRENHFAKKFF